MKEFKVIILKIFIVADFEMMVIVCGNSKCCSTQKVPEF